jgi:Uma2 family endonuclease
MNNLHTSFPRIDCPATVSWWNGAPVYSHGRTQLRLGIFFGTLSQQHSVYASVETRMKLREGLYRIPDVWVFWPSEPIEVPDSPPLIAIEVLSTDDRLTEIREKLEEYRAWGVPHVWLVDPHSERLYICDSGLKEVKSFAIPELDIELAATQIFN